MTKVDINAVALAQNTFAEVVFTAGSTDGFRVDMTGKDNKICLLLQNGGEAAATVIVKKGNGLQGVNDLEEYTIKAGKFACVNLESGAFKNVSGDDQGYAIIVPSSADVKCAEILLP